MARADELARRLVPYLRHVLGVPALDLDGAPEPLGGGFDTEVHAFRLQSLQQVEATGRDGSDQFSNVR